MSKKNSIKCHHCGATLDKGQNFCGDCGQQLNSICPGCSNSNPPAYKFCGQCGHPLVDIGSLVVDRTGLITRADETALELLAHQSTSVVGKPFALLVDGDNLALFFSHWNEILRSGSAQTLDVKLAPTRDVSLYIHLVIERLSDKKSKTEQYRLELNNVTNRQHDIHELQEKKDLLKIITGLTDLFHPLHPNIKRETTKASLEKITMFLSGHYMFIARPNKETKQWLTEYTYHSAAGTSKDATVPAIATKYLQPVLERIGSSQGYNIADLQSLPLPERQLWQSWHQQHEGAVLCEIMYRNRNIAGIIGIFKSPPGPWSTSTRMLIRLAGRLMNPILPKTPLEDTPAQTPVDLTPSSPRKNPEKDAGIIDFQDIEIIEVSNTESTGGNSSPEKIKIFPDNEKNPSGSIPLVANPDGDYLLKCPNCELQRFLPVTTFEENGWILKIDCSCDNTFKVIREQRSTFRKEVQLRGLFNNKQDQYNKMAMSSSWSPIEVTNISKNGLNFTSPRARLLGVGDQIQLQFTLDNSSKSLINKPAQITSIRKSRVGCQFQGSDKQDVTLGFYFL